MRDIGINVKAPEKECTDKNCPFHGNLSVRGQIFRGRVVKTYEKSAVIERELIRYVPKYERYLKKRSKMHAHNPPCIDAKPGDIVTIAECRPISKTKSFVIVEKVVEE
ncbi:archaeal ribosomal protein S17P [Geoglobus ahangari]|uniref:Small ribosomal subunit protein uS17 n=1 Tax=Geoglobus ahangari TaxID=113653 RepID=A0A0F7IHP4_9EURY|nr:30S ribosomal protein S17 [Geoglobus ahangari]AKG92268.1 archaeal ribosomal protein S17P [Geoglobus ahangari]NOY11903.1 30S ribosomal protein S17 [Archaeoglobi archaeon]